MVSFFPSRTLAPRFQPPEIDINATKSPIYTSHDQIYNDVTLVKSLRTSKFSVYLVRSKVTKLDYMMKVFPHRTAQARLLFENERRFACLVHQNVIRHLYFEKESKFMNHTNVIHASCTITEFASNGTFADFIKNHKRHIDDKLVRTYFRQLISGLEYLHKSSISHMDLKLASLWLDDNFTLKIADFEMAHFEEDAIILSEGSTLFRAPEMAEGRKTDPRTTDIYSAAIILFVLKAKGTFPQFENERIGGVHYAELLRNDVNKFWRCHIAAQKGEKIDFEEDFKELFISMTKFDSKNRASIEEIKASKWYNGEVYTAEELSSKMEKIFAAK